jgi:hypothetical protein
VGRAAGADYVVVFNKVLQSGIRLYGFSEIIRDDENIDDAVLRIEPDREGDWGQYQEISHVYDVRDHPLFSTSTPETKSKFAFWVTCECVAAGTLFAMSRPFFDPAADLIDPLVGLLLSTPVAVAYGFALIKIQNLPEGDLITEAWDYLYVIFFTPFHWLWQWGEQVDLHKDRYGWRHPVKWFLNHPVRALFAFAVIGYSFPAFLVLFLPQFFFCVLGSLPLLFLADLLLYS